MSDGTTPSEGTTRTVGIVMNGVTGRMGTNQHLLRSIVPIIEAGGVAVGPEERVLPRPVLVGRNARKLEALAERTGIDRWTTDVDEALADPENEVYFDAQITELRHPSVKKAIEAGKHIYCEKPSGQTVEEAIELYELAEDRDVQHGIVQDKLWLPGIQKVRTLLDTGFFGEVLSVKGDFGYWVFEGDIVAPNRPSWNYREEDGGGMILDMFPHWQYLLENLFGEIQALSCLGTTHIPTRWDEDGEPFTCTADDAAYATFELDHGIVAQFFCSWATRVRRDDLFTLQVDGTEGSAVAGLRKCWVQPYSATPRPTWNPDEDDPHEYRDDWVEAADQEEYQNAFRTQWELFLEHLHTGDPFPWSLREGARGVQLAELGYASSRQRQWLEVPELP